MIVENTPVLMVRMFGQNSGPYVGRVLDKLDVQLDPDWYIQMYQ